MQEKKSDGEKIKMENLLKSQKKGGQNDLIAHHNFYNTPSVFYGFNRFF